MSDNAKTANGVKTFTDGNFQTEVVASGTPVLVDFWAQWCGPCHMLTPTVEQLAGEYDGRVAVGKLNIDENPKTAAEFGIRSIPTILVFQDGKVAEALVGVQPKDRYKDVLDKLTGGN